ncbi:pirin family protein [Paludisphaera sp.]|uniref:pirin family protein n=1 Tax=Paludisphaera sp. TaxID=2017432 RepID=UPI00301D255E
MKKLFEIRRGAEPRWVGDGFPVRTLFSHQESGARISPFLMLDYAGPAEFAPSEKPRGVGEHPHRGFETVTIVYQGELEHRDSAGNHGKIGPGDVQWMTAASGLVHEEWHDRDFSRRGGVLELVQLWVNLPAKDKSAAPGYQEIPAARISTVDLDAAGSARVIAGGFRGTEGPARTFTPITLIDLRLGAGSRVEIPSPEGHSAIVMVLKGKATTAGETLGEADTAILDPDGEGVTVEALDDATILFLGGEPIDEPVVAHGPFVMNTEEEIRQAIRDYRDGRMGRLVPPA